MYKAEDMPVPPSVTEFPTGGYCKTLGALKTGPGHKLDKKNPDKVREQTRQIFGMMTHIDNQAGRVMEALEEKGLTENTVVVWISDHGEMLGSHGGMHKGLFPFDGSMRVPFIINVPWAENKGRVIHEPVSQIDLVPTVLDLCGVEQPEDPLVNEEYKKHLDPMTPPLPGESLKPVLLKGGVPQRKNALVEYNQDTFPEYDNIQMRTLVTEKYKVSMFSPTREVLLFDRENDPCEMQNLADTDEGRKVLPDLLAQLLDEINRTEPRMPRRFSGC
jgi:arylsulfatase